MTIRVIVADDEPPALGVLRALAAEHADVVVVAECRTGRDVVTAVERAAPDLIFLDIQMPDLDGLTAMESLPRETRPLVVFVTAHETFAVRAYGVEAVDYLVKPFDDARFHAAMGRARDRLRARPTSFPPRVLATIGTRSVSVEVATIQWLEAHDYHVRLHAASGTFLVRRSLARFERELDPTRFVRVHRRAIVHLAAVRELRRDGHGGHILRLHDGTALDVSERRYAAVAAALGRPG